MAFYLDPVTVATGALRVLPANNCSPLHEQCWSLHMGIPPHYDTQREKLRMMATVAGCEDILVDSSTNAWGATAIASQPDGPL